MQYEVTYGEKIIIFKHKIQNGLKHAYISLDINEGVILKSRKIPIYKAKEIILKKAPWIIRRLNTISEVKKVDFSQGSLILFLGEKYEMKIIESGNTRNVCLDFTGNQFNVFINPDLEEREKNIQKALGDFYKKRSEKEITPRVIFWSKKMDLYPYEVTYRKLKRRWGSCTHDDRLVFNYNLMQLNQLQIDYIIVHELAHIEEKNHSKNFWSLVEEYIPGCKAIHKNILTSAL
jgi:predicted metal-dependent hydrolase